MLEAKCAFLFYCFSQQRFLGFLVDWREDPKRFVIGTQLISIYLSNAVFIPNCCYELLGHVSVVLFVRFRV